MAIKRITRAGTPIRFPLLIDPDIQKYIFSQPEKDANAAIGKEISYENYLKDPNSDDHVRWMKAFEESQSNLGYRIKMFSDSLNSDHLKFPEEILDSATHVTIKALDGKERHDVYISVVSNNPEFLPDGEKNSVLRGIKLTHSINLEVTQRCLLAIDGFEERPVKEKDGVSRFPMEALRSIQNLEAFVNEVAARMETVSTLGEPQASPSDPS